MDSGRFVLAAVLMIAVMVVTNILFAPDPGMGPGVTADSLVVADSLGEPPAGPGAAADSPLAGLLPDTGAPQGGALPPSMAPAPEQGAGALAGVGTSPAEAAAAPADTVWVQSPLYRYGFLTRGAGLVSARLLRYGNYATEVEDDDQRPPVELVPEGAGALFQPSLRVGDQTIPVEQLAFRVEPAGGLSLAEGAGADTLRFVWSDSTRGVELVVGYAFDADRYIVDGWAYFTGVGDLPQTLVLNIGPTLASNEADVREDQRELGFAVNSQREGIESTPFRSLDESTVVQGPLSWVALKNKYFVVAAVQSPVTGVPFSSVEAAPLGEDDEHAADLTVYLSRGADRSPFAYRLYVGPQDANRLAGVGFQFEDVNPRGWRLFRPIIVPVSHFVIWALKGMHDVLGIQYGWVLILFGILIRVVLWPLNAKAARSQLKTMELQPRIKEIQSKYKNNQEQMQKEMMRLYKEEGFSPFGGCLPMLIPFPVLIALFFVFQSTIEFRGVGFLWLPDLSRPDPFYILPVLLGVSMFLMQWVMRSAAADNPQMKMMMYFMPIFMTVIFLNFASGLNLYYASMNLASIPQQIITVRERQAALAKKR